MAANGINAIRTYTVPPVWLLEAAGEHGLRVMVGLPWEEHVAFLDEPGRASDIERRVREMVRTCGDHGAVLAYVIGNEIPASIVRWHGARRIERFLQRLYRAVKEETPEILVTYVNFPTTEYLQLPFLDFYCFNVYLERQEQLEAYLAQLQNLAGDKPLVMAEIGLDSRRNGEAGQAKALAWQIQTVFAGGCAGVFLFAWTDEWYRGGYHVEDWDFGLTRRNGEPKPALAAVRAALAAVPFPEDVPWPRISVVVCTYNGSRTICETLRGLALLEYPNYEVIVVDDGSTDNTAALVQPFEVRLIRTQNRGLSAARNNGLEAASGSIVAYIDDDAYPDAHWLQYLAWTYLTTEYAGVGGPNIAPANDGKIAECIAHAPGGPAHVLLAAREAEHIPGCNCSFRKECLQSVGGFDPVFRTAGDDVDLCWRLLERGWKLGFHAAAMVWHHRRSSLRTYWKQQKGYGKAEALLERKWPSKYNAAGHVTWAGRLYGRGITRALGHWRIYQGTWGSAPFQRMYEPRPGTIGSLPLMPEWYLVILALLVLVGLQVLWPLLRYAAIPLAIAVLAPMAYVVKTAVSEFSGLSLRYRFLNMALHLAQPVARLWGRIHHGLTPWRCRGLRDWTSPLPQRLQFWSEQWHSTEEWLASLERALSTQAAVSTRGGDFDQWDLQIRGGLLGGVRMRLAVEEHGEGKQLLRLRAWPVVSRVGLGITGMFAMLTMGAALERSFSVASLLACFGAVTAMWSLQGCAQAKAAWVITTQRLRALQLQKSASQKKTVETEQKMAKAAKQVGAGQRAF
jgi:GT2 family glycosyltransferase